MDAGERTRLGEGWGEGRRIGIGSEGMHERPDVSLWLPATATTAPLSTHIFLCHHGDRWMHEIFLVVELFFFGIDSM